MLFQNASKRPNRARWLIPAKTKVFLLICVIFIGNLLLFCLFESNPRFEFKNASHSFLENGDCETKVLFKFKGWQKESNFNLIVSYIPSEIILKDIHPIGDFSVIEREGDSEKGWKKIKLQAVKEKELTIKIITNKEPTNNLAFDWSPK